jgi:endonuclease/exonuclease/phosphatase family metal-dependent hydrolase
MKRILLHAFIIFTLLLPGCKSKSDKDSFKVITFNIRYDNPNDSINAWPNRASLVASFLKAEKPDLFGIQEAVVNQYEYLDSILTDYESVGVGRNDGAKGGEMNPVFYRKARFDMIRTKTFWLSETPEIAGSQAWGAGLPRIVTWMELVEKETHEHLFYFNTHFAHDSDSARILSSSLLLTMVDSIATEFPFIITGDFNMTPDAKGYAILTGPAESVPLLSDSYLISAKKPGGPVSTFNGFSDKNRSGRIDYIFIKSGMKVLDHNTIIRKEKGVFISDHWPVEAIISLK